MRSGLYYITIIVSIGLVSLASNSVTAQTDELKKEVHVVRPYEPSISDANKINLQPKIIDTIKVNPNFTYSIVQRPVETYFTPTPLTAARMVSEPLPDLRMSYMRIGLGNTILPYAEAYLSSNRHKEYLYGAWVKFFNTSSKVELTNNLKVKAPASNIDLMAFGKRLLNKKILQGDIGFNRNNRTFYGYFFDNPTITPTNDKQSINRFAANLEFKTTNKDSASLNYLAQTNFYHLSDKYDLQETMIAGLFNLNKFIGQEQFGGEIAFTHYGRSNSLGSKNNNLLQIKPWAHFFGDEWHAYAGLNIIFDANGNVNNTYFFPRAYLSYDIVSHYIIPYVEIDGYVQDNSYSYLLQQNPWLSSKFDTWNTIYKLVVGGGIKGKFSPTISYHVNANYAIIDSLGLMINTSIDAANPLFNRFDIVYDNTERTTVKGELAFEPTKSFHIKLNGAFYQYKTQNALHPWHLPDYEISGYVQYLFRNKLKLNAEIFGLGKRWVKDPTDSPIRLKEYIDINLGAEYSYNKRMSVFISVNNLTGTKYQQWYLYPNHTFNMLAGVSYKF